MLQHSFICQTKENTSLRCDGRLTQKTQREERPEAQFWLLFVYVFSPPLEPALCELSWPGGLFVSPEVLDLVSDFRLFYFCRLFSSLCFSHHCFGILFHILTS